LFPKRGGRILRAQIAIATRRTPLNDTPLNDTTKSYLSLR